jgi:hypothetical protein
MTARPQKLRTQNANAELRKRGTVGEPTDSRFSSFCIRILRSEFLWPTAAILLFPTIANACPVCFGDPNSAMTKGTNNGIFFLLGIIGFVQLGFVTMFWSFWRRARALRARRDSMRIIDGGQFR